MSTIYILVLFWDLGFGDSARSTALAIEFNSAKACQIASANIGRFEKPKFMVCVPKGEENK
jgi:hypothetical protein